MSISEGMLACWLRNVTVWPIQGPQAAVVTSVCTCLWVVSGPHVGWAIQVYRGILQPVRINLGLADYLEIIQNYHIRYFLFKTHLIQRHLNL
jgi:hypothetical protein